MKEDETAQREFKRESLSWLVPGEYKHFQIRKGNLKNNQRERRKSGNGVRKAHSKFPEGLHFSARLNKIRSEK